MTYTHHPEPWLAIALAVVEQAFNDISDPRPEKGDKKQLAHKSLAFVKSEWCGALLSLSRSNVDHGTAVARAEAIHAETIKRLNAI